MAQLSFELDRTKARALFVFNSLLKFIFEQKPQEVTDNLNISQAIQLSFELLPKIDCSLKALAVNKQAIEANYNWAKLTEQGLEFLSILC